MKQYLENISSFLKTQIAALREVAELFDSMRRRDKELVNMVGKCVCACVRTCVHAHACLYVYVDILAVCPRCVNSSMSDSSCCVNPFVCLQNDVM